MAKFKLRFSTCEAVQLRWDTWSEMCDFVGMGGLANNHPEGCMFGNVMGLIIPTEDGALVAKETDWVLKNSFGALCVESAETMALLWQDVEEEAPTVANGFAVDYFVKYTCEHCGSERVVGHNADDAVPNSIPCEKCKPTWRHNYWMHKVTKED